MSIDLSSLLGTQRQLRVARADYDGVRDGLGQYQHTIETEVIAAGSIILGWLILTTLGITTAAGGNLQFLIGATYTGYAQVVINQQKAELHTGGAANVLDKDCPIIAYCDGGALTAGAASIWVFYLPTVG